MRRFALAVLACLVAQPVFAQQQGGFTPGATAADLAALQSTIPQPADTVSPYDQLYAGSLGSSPKYRRQDGQAPRITRSFSVTTNASGAATASWATMPMPAGSQVVLTPLYTGQGNPQCWKTTTVATTQVGIQCAVFGSSTASATITLGGLTAAATTGLNLANLLSSLTAASGMVVDVVVLPPSQ